jgi:hypothetical protein
MNSMQNVEGPRRHNSFLDQQDELRRALGDRNLSPSAIQDAIDSGYFAWRVGQYGSDVGRPGVMDSYYGNKYSGLIELDRFVEYLRNGSITTLPSRVKEYRVKSIREAISILNSRQHASCAGLMSFRGQTMDVKIKRSIPNPQAKDDNGNERMIVPSWWRRWIDKNPAERTSTPSDSPFSNSLFSAPLLYFDIPNWREHLLHSGRQDWGVDGIACKVCKEMSAREEGLMLNAAASNEAPLLEQHYGMPTIGLDVTFDLSVAFFFASHKFVRHRGERASFEPVESGKHQGVVYCFVFEWPSVTETSFLIRDIKMFKHLTPLRPIRQRCGLPAFHIHEIGAAARDLDAIMYIDESFDLSGLPTMAKLFPSRKEDVFYGALLDARDQMPDIWGQIVDYEE